MGSAIHLFDHPTNRFCGLINGLIFADRLLRNKKGTLIV